MTFAERNELITGAIGAVRPWNSVDANVKFDTLPQQRIDFCLMCQHCADACDKCDGQGNLRNTKMGRPKKEIDYDLLREMLTLKSCNAEMCKALGVGLTTLKQAKRALN